MSILQIQNVSVGQVGVLPATVKMATTDNLATITAAGYLNSANSQGIAISPSTIIEALYSYNQITNSGTYGVFAVSISNGVISLVQSINNPVVENVSSATPGTVRAFTGNLISSATTMTSGNIVGVRGAVNMVGASGGFIYGVQGKVISTGTLSGSSWTTGIFGQVDVSAAIINAGQVAAIWGDWGATGATATDMSGTSGIKFTNTTANKLNEQINTYGDATFYLNIRGNPGPLSYYLAAGTSGGSAGDAAHCAAQQVLKIVVQGATVYIPVFTSNS